MAPASVPNVARARQPLVIVEAFKSSAVEIVLTKEFAVD
eukprot:CAMPEP_0185006092 /NCGR_PEP_ID=MMETSP1098-20130426/83681_1 /TAXON_ID=89044 /ORGANISM="Spumella elongata, Strain CCAP 955/1" /LENGTH=38 /DNA_ID= /DNA_START= /DNA_END= /DNA_ORIENTATION=